MEDTRHNQHSVAWLIQAIQTLPSDQPVPQRTRGYNVYTTQKDHWLGWLQPASGTGTYSRQSGDAHGAQRVYNSIGEPLMLLWLAKAAGVRLKLIESAQSSADGTANLRSKCGRIRTHIPWPEIAAALWSLQR